MRALFLFFLLVLLPLAVSASPEPPGDAPGALEAAATAAPGPTGPVVLVEVEGPINPGTSDYLAMAVARAAEEGAAAVVVRLDTPGGLLESTRQMVQVELSAEVPVIVWVGPPGARAASAGVFITMAAHVAAMAPGTTIGAAHPVDLLGGGGGGDEGQEDPEGQEGGGDAAAGRRVMEEKILNDTVAWARTIAGRRDRNADWAERAVRESVAVTDTEAVVLDVVDLVAPDVRSLLEQVDGRTVELASGPVRLQTAGATIQPLGMTVRQKTVHFLGDPNVIFVLLALGALGLYVEFNNPGLVVPGVLGVLCLLSAGVGLSILPFNVAGLFLVFLAFGLFALEIWVPSYGALTAGGVAALVLGGILLFDVQEFDLRVSTATLITVSVIAGALALLVGWLVLRSRRGRSPTGSEGLVGAEGVVTQGGEGAGWIRVEGEIWKARWTGRLEPGTPIRVRTVHRLELEVEAVPAPGPR